MDEEKQARFGFGGQVATATQWYDDHRSGPVRSEQDDLDREMS